MIWDNIGLVWSNGIIVGFHPVQARVRTEGGRRSVNLLIVISSFTARPDLQLQQGHTSVGYSPSPYESQEYPSINNQYISSKPREKR